jgi:hypothetical protein
MGKDCWRKIGSVRFVLNECAYIQYQQKTTMLFIARRLSFARERFCLEKYTWVCSTEQYQNFFVDYFEQV